MSNVYLLSPILCILSHFIITSLNSILQPLRPNQHRTTHSTHHATSLVFYNI
ncbi:hypothetical protein Hanom_Chr04g00323991 [Helianthus anomalus]